MGGKYDGAGVPGLLSKLEGRGGQGKGAGLVVDEWDSRILDLRIQMILRNERNANTTEKSRPSTTFFYGIG